MSLPSERAINFLECPSVHSCAPRFISASLISRGLLRKELIVHLLESVIPECSYPSISLGTVRFSNRRESRRDRNWTPD
jgi:hypothetical protein